MYPRVMWLAGDIDEAPAPWMLGQLALGQGAILSWDDEARPWSVAKALRQLHPEMTLLAYIRGSFWPDRRDQSREGAPHRNAVLDLLQDKAMWSHGDDGQRIRPFGTGEALLSGAGVGELAQYVAATWDGTIWDGVHLDVMTPEWWHLGAPRAVSEELLPAMQEMATLLDAAGITVQGNGAWAPPATDFGGRSPYWGLIDGCFAERWPSYPWYALDGARRPAIDEAYAWHMSLAQMWQEAGATLYTMHAEGLDQQGYFGQWVKSDRQGARFVLANSLLAGCWFTPPERSTPFVIDEMFVTDGATSWSREGIGWLGQPVSPAIWDGPSQMWVRVFQRGLAVVNPGTTAQQITLDAGVYRRINGMFDRPVNDGSPVRTLEVGAMDAAVLWRVGEALEAPVEDGDRMALVERRLEAMDRDLERAERRLERMERGLNALFQALAE